MDPYTPNPSPSVPPPDRDRPANDIAKRTTTALGRDFVVIGRAHIKAWHAWLLIGLAAGIAAGVILVASRSGELPPGQAETGQAQTATPVSFSADILGYVATVDVQNRRITFVPMGAATIGSNCGVVVDPLLGSSIVGIWSTIITGQYPLLPLLTVPANATITRAGIPIALSDLRASTATQSGDYFTARVTSSARGGTAVAQSINALGTGTLPVAGKITGISTTTPQSVILATLTGKQTFALHAATKVSFISQSGGVQPATLADLAVNKTAVIQFVPLQGVKTAAQIVLPTGPVTAPSSISFGILSQVQGVNSQSSQLALFPFRSNLHVPGQCVVLNPIDTIYLWLIITSNYLPTFNPFTATLAPGATVTKANIPASFSDIQVLDTVDVVARYDTISKTTTYTSVDVLSGRKVLGGKITGTSSTTPQSVTIRTITGSTQTLLIQPSTLIFVVTPQGTFVPGSISDLQPNKNAAATWALVGGSQIAIQIAVQQ